MTASTETLIWKPMANVSIPGIASAWEALVLVPVDYEAENAPLIPVNIQKYSKADEIDNGNRINIWFIPGGPGQSSQTLEAFMDAFIKYSPANTCIYAVDHRGLGKSTPLANESEVRLLKQSTKDPSVLVKILDKKQRQLGLLAPLTRVLRVENVARDLLKAVTMVKRQDSPAKSRNFLFSVSYGTVIARRALQIGPDVFESAILDGFAAIERIEHSNEADRALQEFCDMTPSCKNQLNDISVAKDKIKIRKLIPRILTSGPNHCISHFQTVLSNHGLCGGLHAMLNSALTQDETIVKVSILRMILEMISCKDYDGFVAIFQALEGRLRGTSHKQSVAVLTSKTPAPQSNHTFSVNELVFEVISALERYDVTSRSIDICFNKKHTIQGDDSSICPSRLFDPCRFFQTTFDRKMALAEYAGSLPETSIRNPEIISNSTRIIVLAGLVDFSTPTLLSREIFKQFIFAPSKTFYEFSGVGHGIFGSEAKCDKEIMHDFLEGGDATESCRRSENARIMSLVEQQFNSTLLDLATNVNQL